MLEALNQELQEQGFTVVGIALDDVQRVREFASELGITYPVLVGSTDVMSSVVEFGNAGGVLPYSVLVDREGIVRWVIFGVLKEETLRNEITSLLTKV